MVTLWLQHNKWMGASDGMKYERTLVTVCWMYPLMPNSASFGNRLPALKRQLYTGSTELHSSCVLMRWILMTPSPVHWSLIPIQGGLVFKFIIKSRVISALTHTVCYGKLFEMPNGQFLFMVFFYIFHKVLYHLANCPLSLFSVFMWNDWHVHHTIAIWGWTWGEGSDQCLAIVCAT